jgi:hypothetical protein
VHGWFKIHMHRRRIQHTVISSTDALYERPHILVTDLSLSVEGLI